MKRIAILAAVLIAFAAGTAAVALPAYIDIQSGIIVGRGEEKLSAGRSYDDIRLSAIENAKENIIKVLERQPVDLESLESRTIGDYIASNPTKKSVVNSFLDTATVFRESKTKDGLVEVTLLLQIEGPNGYKSMLARLTGKGGEFEKVGPAFSSDSMDAGVKEALKENLATRGLDESTRPFKIIMLPFVNFSETDKVDLGSIFNARLLDRFKKDRRLEFLSENEADSVLSDNSLTDELIEKADANTKVRLNGVDGLIDGVFTKFRLDMKKHGVGAASFYEMSYDAEIELHILNSKTGRWIYFDAISASASDRVFTGASDKDPMPAIRLEDFSNIQSPVYKLMASLVEKAEEIIRNSFPLEGYVLKVAGERVYINLTKADGLKEGDFLTVYRIGDELVDPVTGDVIDRIRDRIGTIRVEDVKDTYTQCSTSETPVEPVNPGDVVTKK